MQDVVAHIPGWSELNTVRATASLAAIPMVAILAIFGVLIWLGIFRLLRAEADGPLVRQKRNEAGAWISFYFGALHLFGGMLSNSLLLFAMSFASIASASEHLLSFFALQLMDWKPTRQCTFGFQQAGALGVFLVMVFLWLMAAAQLVHVVQHLVSPEFVCGVVVTMVSAASLASKVVVCAFCGGFKADVAKVLTTPVSETAPEAAVVPRTNQETAPLDHGLVPQEGTCNVPNPVPPLKIVGTVLRGPRTSSHPASPRWSSRSRSANELVGISRDGQPRNVWSCLDWLITASALVEGFCLWNQQAVADSERTSHGGHNFAVPTKYGRIDSILAAVVIAHVVIPSRHAMREALMQLLMACPRHLNLLALEVSLSQVEGVSELHDVHVWQSGALRCCSAHIVVEDACECSKILHKCTEIAKQEHKLQSVAFQMEVKGDFDKDGERLRLSNITCHDTQLLS